MTLGDKLKQLRTDKNWTQPQAAEAIGIEQSYLSKLENDKSVPSAEILAAILNAFAVDVEKFLDGVNLAQLDRQLLQTPVIAAAINTHRGVRIHSIKKWLFSSAIALALGLTFIAAGHLGLLFSNKQFQYSSPGVVLSGESLNIFEDWEQNLRPPIGTSYTLELYTVISEKKKEMIHRLAQDYLLVDDYRGESFALAVDGGRRLYTVDNDFPFGLQVNRSENRTLMLLGFLLAFSGLTGFFVEYRLRKIN